MKIVIDIPEEEYKYIKEIYEHSHTVEATYSYIYHGTPLPEHHGRIIDESKISKVYWYEVEAINNNIKAINIEIMHTDAPTIIEADKGVLEKINEKQDSLRATCKAWDEAISRDGYVD